MQEHDINRVITLTLPYQRYQHMYRIKIQECTHITQ